MGQRFGLRFYLALAFALTGAVIAAAFGLVAGRNVFDTMQQRIGGFLIYAARNAETEFGRELGERIDDTDIYAATIADAGVADIGGLKRIGVTSVSHTGRNFGCDWTAGLDLDGRVATASPEGPAIGQSFAASPWFAEATHGLAVDARISVDSNGRPALALVAARPLKGGDDKAFAVLVCGLGTDWAARTIDRIARFMPGPVAATELLLIDAEDEAVLSSQAAASGRLPAGLRTLEGNQGGWANLQWPDGKEYLTAVAPPLTSGPLARLNWHFVARRPSADAMEPALAVRDRIYWFSALLALVGVALGAIAADRVLLPLRRIADAAERIGRGELGAHIPALETYHEVALLSRSLHAMLAALRANEARLAALNENLDQRVRQRTTEIAEAHEALARQESRLRAVIETAMDGVMIVGEEHRIQIFNPACERMFGWKAEEIIGRQISELVGGENRTLRGSQLAFDELMGPLPSSDFAPGQVRTVRGRRRDGTTFPLEVSLSRTTIEGGPVYVAIARDVTEAVRARQELFALATKDALTGLRNRRYFLEGAETEFARARRHGRGFSLLILDVDHFKKVNDTYGHAAGDRCLQGLAEVCNRNLREVDLIGRLGGEEFAVAMPEADLATARLVAERLRQQIAENEVAGDQGPLRITVSIGVSSARPEDKGLDQTLRRADQALYTAKNSGRNRVAVDGPGPVEGSSPMPERRG